MLWLRRIGGYVSTGAHAPGLLFWCVGQRAEGVGWFARLLFVWPDVLVLATDALSEAPDALLAWADVLPMVPDVLSV